MERAACPAFHEISKDACSLGAGDRTFYRYPKGFLRDHGKRRASILCPRVRYVIGHCFRGITGGLIFRNIFTNSFDCFSGTTPAGGAESSTQSIRKDFYIACQLGGDREKTAGESFMGRV